MLMVIFGAGASYDSSPNHTPSQMSRDANGSRPPLAGELFHRHYLRFSDDFPLCKPLLAELAVSEAVEGVLERYAIESSRDDRHKQLLSIQYYIKSAIEHCTHGWLEVTHGVTNYGAIIDQMRGLWPETPVGSWLDVIPNLHERAPMMPNAACFVTFNYDTLIEEAFVVACERKFSEIDAYIAGADWPIYKLHGSTDWVTRVPMHPHNSVARPSVGEIIRHAPYDRARAVVVKKGSSSPMQYALCWELPALAIPTVSKSIFICPDNHLRTMKAAIPHVTEIAIIGWRANEKHFLALLREGLVTPVNVIAACGTKDESSAAIQRLHDSGISIGNRLATDHGFTDFIRHMDLSWLAGQRRV